MKVSSAQLEPQEARRIWHLSHGQRSVTRPSTHLLRSLLERCEGPLEHYFFSQNIESRLLYLWWSNLTRRQEGEHNSFSKSRSSLNLATFLLCRRYSVCRPPYSIGRHQTKAATAERTSLSHLENWVQDAKDSRKEWLEVRLEYPCIYFCGMLAFALHSIIHLTELPRR